MTNPRLSWLFLSLTGAALALAAYAWGRSSSAPSVMASEAGPRIAALEREVRRLRAASNKATRPPVEVAARPAANPVMGSEVAQPDGAWDNGEPAAPPVEEQTDPDEVARQAEEKRAKFFDELSQRIDTETIDGAWRHRTEGPLKRLLVQHLEPEASISEATCASSFCRVKLSHPNSSRIPSNKVFDFISDRTSLEVGEVLFDYREERVTTLYFKRGEAPTARAD
jgi:hypothetical protein